MISIFTLLSLMAWLVLQAVVWSKWRGFWRIFASIPVVVGVSGCFYYSVIQDSNWGPTWFVIVAPFCVGYLLLLCGVHFLVTRHRNDVA